MPNKYALEQSELLQAQSVNPSHSPSIGVGQNSKRKQVRKIYNACFFFKYKMINLIFFPFIQKEAVLVIVSSKIVIIVFAELGGT